MVVVASGHEDDVESVLKAAQNGFPSGPDLFPIQSTCQHLEKKKKRSPDLDHSDVIA